MKLLRKTSKEFQNNINVKYITESKLFWETVKALFTGKTLKDEDITLILTIHLCQLKANYLKFLYLNKYFGTNIQDRGLDGLTNISSDFFKIISVQK